MEVRRTKQEDDASILDLPNDTLPPEIWDLSEDVPRMRRKLRSNIIKHARTLASTHGFEIKAIYMYGSSATYQYTSSADIDISIYPVSLPEGSSYEEILEKIREVHVPYGTYEIHYYLKKPDAELAETADGSYDVLNDIWLITPVKPEEGYDPLLDHEEMVDVADQRVSEFDEETAKLDRYLSIIERTLAQEKYQEGDEDLLRRLGSYLGKIHDQIEVMDAALLSLKTRRDEFHKTLKPGVVQDRFHIDEVIYKYLDSSGAYVRYEEALDRYDAILNDVAEL